VRDELILFYDDVSIELGAGFGTRCNTDMPPLDVGGSAVIIMGDSFDFGMIIPSIPSCVVGTNFGIILSVVTLVVTI
jgi:hypothetical protein